MSGRSATLAGLALATAVLHHTFDNGLTVLLAPRPGTAAVAVQAWIGVGSADEPADRAGIAHAFEHMLFRGTERRGTGAVARDIEAAGGSINAWTSLDQTVLHAVVPAGMLPAAVDVIADAVLCSTFDAGALAREREVIAEEIRHAGDDPARCAAQALFATAFARHPYGRPVIGTTDSVRRLTRDQLVDFHARWYAPHNATIVVAGDVDPDDALAHVDRAFGAWRPRAVRRKTVVEPTQTAPRAVVVAQDVREARVAVGFRIPPLRHDDTAAIDALAMVLGHGESSRLHAAAPAARDPFAYAHALRDPGLLIVGAAAAPDRARRALRGLVDEVFRLAHEPVDAAELARARRVALADAVYQDETAEGAARKLGYYALVAGDPEFERGYLRRLRALTPGAVVDVARRYLRPEQATVALLAPPAGALARASGRAARERALVRELGAAASAASARYARRVAVVPRGQRVTRHVLASGTVVIVERDPSVPVVAMRAAWVGGVRYETPANSGINQLLARTVTRGCGELSAAEVAQHLDEAAGSLSGYAGRNSFGLRAEWLADDWEAGFDLLAACALRPRLPNAEVVRERRRLLEELAGRGDDPGQLAFLLLAQALYGAHPYSLDPLGSDGAVARITRTALADYAARHYPASRMTLVVVGDVDPEAVLRRAERAFGDAPRARTEPPDVPAVAAGSGTGPRQVFGYLDRQQAHLVVGFPGVAVDDPDRYALEVLMTVLGGQGGRLFVELRDRQGLAYRLGALSVEGIDRGYLAVHIACSPDKLEAAFAGIREQLRGIAEGGERAVTADELDRAIRYLVGSHELAQQRRSAVAAALAFHEIYGLGPERYRAYPSAIRAVTAADVQRVAARYLDWSAAVIATVQPPVMSPAVKERARGVRKRLDKKRKSAR